MFKFKYNQLLSGAKQIVHTLKLLKKTKKT